MFETVDYMAKRNRLSKTTIATVNDVIAKLSTFELLEETGENAYGVQVYTGNWDGPHQSSVTELYYDVKGALLESLSIANDTFGIAPSVWSKAIGLE